MQYDYTDTELTIVMPTKNVEKLNKLFKDGEKIKDVYLDDFKLIHTNKNGMSSIKMKLECLDNCDDTLFRPTTDHYGLSDLIEKLDIKRLYVFSKGSGWNRYGFKGPFWESAFYDATDYDATLKFENGNLPYNSACSTYCYDFDKAPEYFDKGVKNYREQYEHDFPVSEEDLDLLEDNEEEMG